VLLKLMERFPVIITLGGALLGYLAGEMLVTDPAVSQWLGARSPHPTALASGILGAAAVVGVGLLLRRRTQASAKS